MPCQWTAAGSCDWLTIVTATRLPRSSSSIGPGTGNAAGSAASGVPSRTYDMPACDP